MRFERQLNELLGSGVGRLPHAVLLTGPAGLGKSVFARLLAHVLLCENPKGQAEPCGTCDACHWIGTGNHPDLRIVEPDTEEDPEDVAKEKAKKRAAPVIKIDQIRDLESFVFVGSHRNGRRVVVINEAETMNVPAANSLLKILEEPPPSVYFLLSSSRQKYLLPTIRSRCRATPFATPDRKVAQADLAEAGIKQDATKYLDLAAGAPKQVLRWKDAGQFQVLDGLIDSLSGGLTDPLALASRWDALLKGAPGFSLDQLVEGIQRWLLDLAQESATGSVRYHQGWRRPKAPPGGYDLKLLSAAWRELIQFRGTSRHPLNQLLFLEDLATSYLRSLRPAQL